MSRFGSRQFASAVRAAGCIVRDGLAAERAEPRFWSRFRFGQEAVQLFEDHEDGKGDNQELNDRVEKGTVRNDRDPGGFRFGQGIDVFCAQRDEEVRKINPAEEDPKWGA